jgi:hypothetical protein
MRDKVLLETWKGMRQRCGNKNNTSYKNYGGRGISICKRWESYENFIKDMGPKPSPRHSIDRINVNGNYEPSNCRWATPSQQTKNRRIPTTCKSGHKWTNETTIITNRGESKRCRICLLMRIANKPPQDRKHFDSCNDKNCKKPWCVHRAKRNCNGNCDPGKSGRCKKCHRKTYIGGLIT